MNRMMSAITVNVMLTDDTQFQMQGNPGDSLLEVLHLSPA